MAFSTKWDQLRSASAVRVALKARRAWVYTAGEIYTVTGLLLCFFSAGEAC